MKRPLRGVPTKGTIHQFLLRLNQPLYHCRNPLWNGVKGKGKEKDLSLLNPRLKEHTGNTQGYRDKTINKSFLVILLCQGN